MQQLEHCELSSDRKKELGLIMVNGNKVLEKWYKEYKNQAKVKQKSVAIRSDRAFAMHLWKITKGKVKSVKIIGFTIPKTDIESIFSVKAIELEVMAGYVKLLNKAVKKYRHLANEISFLDREDLYNEGVLALQNCVYKYKSVQYQFITLAHTAVHRAVRRALYNSNSFCQYTNECHALRGTYEKIKTNNSHLSDEAIIEMMNLSDSEKEILVSSYSKMINQSEIGGNRPGNDSFGDDLPSDDDLFFSITNHAYQMWDKVYDKERFIDWELIDNLSDIEKQVLYHYCVNTPEWRTRLAAKTINPATKKKYSRYGMTVILERVLKKLRATVQESE